VDANLLETKVAIEKQIRYSSAIREIEMAVLELKFNLMQLQESLDVTSAGKLISRIKVFHSPTDAVFINPRKFLKFTLKLKVKLLLHVSVHDHHQGA
jgi:hypothetical protein